MPEFGPLPQLVVGQSASRLAISDVGNAATTQNFQAAADPYVPPEGWTATANAYTNAGSLRTKSQSGEVILTRPLEASGLYVFEATFENPEGFIAIMDTLGGSLYVNPQGAAGPLVLYYDSPANQPAGFQYGVLSVNCAVKGEVNLATGNIKLYTKRDGVDSDFVLRLESTRGGRTYNEVRLAISAAAKLDSFFDAVPLPVTVENAPEGSRVVVNGVEYDPALPFPVATAGSFVWLVGADGAALALPCFAKSGNVLTYVEDAPSGGGNSEAPASSVARTATNAATRFINFASVSNGPFAPGTLDTLHDGAVTVSAGRLGSTVAGQQRRFYHTDPSGAGHATGYVEVEGTSNTSLILRRADGTYVRFGFQGDSNLVAYTDTGGVLGAQYNLVPATGRFRLEWDGAVARAYVNGVNRLSVNTAGPFTHLGVEVGEGPASPGTIGTFLAGFDPLPITVSNVPTGGFVTLDGAAYSIGAETSRAGTMKVYSLESLVLAEFYAKPGDTWTL